MNTDDHKADAARATEERQLNEVRNRLDRALRELDERLEYYARDIRQQKEYLWSSRDEMDHIEKISARESIQQTVMTGDATLDQKKRLLKLRQSPYFGRFDFHRHGRTGPEATYIGVHHFHDPVDRRIVVHDWRAPIATLFYDFETGPAHYESPEGRVEGEVRLKRQFRINNGTIELMVESSLHVVDDVLLEELNRASDDSMRNIVATIQRDQNAIIRDEDANVIIIQGVAGSGKTSIALHRIAFLLYRFKDTLSSEDMLIISPNRVFSDYIGNVLPELGEESIQQMGMDDLADELLEGQYRFQTFFEQATALLEKDDEDLKRRIRFKSTPAFLAKLDEYATHLDRERFRAEDVWVARRLVPGWLLEEIFRKHHALDIRERIRQLLVETEQRIGIQYHYDLTPEDRKALREAVRGMVRRFTLRQAYKDFYDWLGEPDLFRLAKGKLEHADLFPLIHLKMRLEGIRSPYKRVKHLLIDEMQDYSAVQYSVIARLFDCKMTILGDANQSVNPYSASTAGDIQRVFRGATCVTLNKSYRSSYEIARFALHVSPNPELEVMERHGEAPEVIRCGTRGEELERILGLLEEFSASDYGILGVVCKTQRRAQQLYQELRQRREEVFLLSEQTQALHAGVVVCCAHMAKGLEFDQVIVPDAGERHYRTPMDRNLLYVACTRAKHRLSLTHTGQASEFLPPKAR